MLKCMLDNSGLTFGRTIRSFFFSTVKNVILMGNTCVGPSISKNSFFQSVSAAVWRSRLPADNVSTTNEESRKTGNLKDFYTLGKKLGQGQFGTTFLCVEKATGKKFACKSIAKRKLLAPDDVEDIMHHLAGHPNVISIKGAYEDGMAVHVIMELCEGGELFDRIIQRGHYTERKAAELTRIIVGVVEACHSLGVMHRDLKPENFLFVDQKEDSLLKTIDFGLSIFFKPDMANGILPQSYDAI
ncbi:unnamed protein product [Thlaspi arvense]|uniref:non-specific serine/threonine protein kinase n=1 Tax=Thlaspi arvense TaxID=13288 RepID=A0AAU9S3D3_THLAR|nr:unnamed protein product [Thlaspi arvense]